MQEILNQILAKLEGLEKGQQSLEKGQQVLEKGQQEMSKKIDSIEDAQSILAVEVKGIKETVNSINNTVVKIENGHGEKLSALFDGWKQNTEQLDRIEKEVTRQEEVILRKVK